MAFRPCPRAATDVDGLDDALRTWLAKSRGKSSSVRGSLETSSSNSPTAPQPTKRHKTTYYQRKDEINDLREEAAKLEEDLRRLTSATEPHQDTLDLHGLFQRDIERNNLRLAGVQAMLAAQAMKLSQSPTLVPLTTHIHLPQNEAARFEALASLRESKLESALRFLTERMRGLDLRQSHHQIHIFDLPTADFGFTGLDVVQFTGGFSVRQVFEESVFFSTNQEMSVTESVGMLTIRESGEFEDVSLGQTRLVAKVTEGLEVEANMAIFSQCVDATETQPGHAISVVDFVGVDDLYPYQPSSRGRKEVVAAVLFTEIQSPRGGLVAMAKWSHVRFRMPPHLDLSDDLQDTLRESMVKWCDVMPAVIQERLAMRSPVPHQP